MHRLILFMMGLLFVVISGANIAMGAEWTFTQISNFTNFKDVDFAPFGAPLVDGTIRFLSVLMLVFGLIMLRSVRDCRDNRKLMPTLSSILIFGGLARLWSIYSIGDTSLYSFISALIEILPAILILLLFVMGGRRRDY